MMTIRTSKLIKAPIDMENARDKKGSLKLNGLTVIAFCLHTQSKTGTFFLKDHLLLYVKSGAYTVRFGDQTVTVRSNEMVFLHKSIVIEYDKSGESGSENLLDYMMFFLNDNLLKDFIKFAGISPTYPENDVIQVANFQVNDHIRAYIDSLETYLNKPNDIHDGLVRVKLMELLFLLTDSNEPFLLQLFQPSGSDSNRIQTIMEENYTNPVSLPDLAFLSGRSLSTFKREFQAIYNTSPLKWIRKRRLEKAQQLLIETNLSVTDICYSSGFENIAHFSKVFKEEYGLPPSEFRQQFRLQEEKNKVVSS